MKCILNLVLINPQGKMMNIDCNRENGISDINPLLPFTMRKNIKILRPGMKM
jgi:hypothetical protein